MTIFGKILEGEIPADVVYEDEEYLVFKDIQPKMKTHLLIIPKRTDILSFHTVEGKEERQVVHGMLDIAWKIIDQQQLQGCQLRWNSGPDHGQEVMHIHLHLLSHSPLQDDKK